MGFLSPVSPLSPRHLSPTTTVTDQPRNSDDHHAGKVSPTILDLPPVCASPRIASNAANPSALSCEFSSLLVLDAMPPRLELAMAYLNAMEVFGTNFDRLMGRGGQLRETLARGGSLRVPPLSYGQVVAFLCCPF